ncbi:MAG: hypothetical protein NTV62_04430, partial [Candidatus Gribaldobacteria bacterium]|nr:hypothetical protein [Candidatus Gribaldobacteria bacterium]
SYRLQEKIKEIKKRFSEVNQHNTKWDQVDALSVSFSDFWDLLAQRSIFVTKKLIVLENLLKSLDFSEQFLKKIKEIVASQNVIVITDRREKIKKDKNQVKADQKKKKEANVIPGKLLKVLLAQGQPQEFEKLEGVKLKNWIIREFAKYNKKVGVLALNKLITLAGRDTWKLSLEINKLANYQAGVEILLKDVGLLVKGQVLPEIFKTLDVIAKRDTKGALNLIEDHLQEGEEPIYLLSMLAFQFRSLLLLKASLEEDRLNNVYSPLPQVAKKLGIHPYTAQKSLLLVNRFSLPELKNIYQRIFEIEVAVKTGQVSATESLRLLISQI